ncbi:hypothetical protein KRX57_05980 [Weeksellaceae bacterium TAE3-ERU29]|nr:hypothetical protein [Weeksellaceae bacterium TAE3-ERU29]
MKKLIFSINFVLFSTLLIQAQVGIETENIGQSALLDFPGNITDGSYARKGILLPKVNDKTTAGTRPGTFIFDMDEKKVSYYDGKTNEWKPMSSAPGQEVANEITAYSIGENEGSTGALITNQSESVGDAPDGVLSLVSSDKALALPKVKDVTLLPKPKAGMICYDVASKAVAVFNGEIWEYWRGK